MYWLTLFLALAAPFWEAKPPADWTDIELASVFAESPWAQMVNSQAGVVAEAPVQIYLASADPMIAAEHERDLRIQRRRPPGTPVPDDPLADDYHTWLDENRATQIVLAVHLKGNAALSDSKEVQKMEDECVMRVGKKKYKMTGHFPPYDRDPYLRLAFPRVVQPGDKSVLFELYVPGLGAPYRDIEFSVRDLLVNGKLVM